MAERVAGVLAWDDEHEHAGVSDVSDDDLGLARVSVPPERDRVTGVVTCIQFDKHASRVRFLARDRARVNAWFSTGIDPLVHAGGEVVRGDQTGADARSVCTDERLVW
jgi:hypothetical protein